ncbi:MAG: phospholipid carrier-dependent glycosyltransferase [Bacteroidota bacterium]
MIQHILAPQTVEAFGWTLIHSLWQGAAFALLLVVMLILLHKYSAQSRYVVSVGMLCAFFITVSATFWTQWENAGNRIALMDQQLVQQTNA